MKYSHKFSDAIHIMAFLDIYKDGDTSSRMIASSIESNPSVVRDLMSSLSKAGFITSRQGVAGASLAKSPKDISLLDIYKAIDIDHRLLHVDPKTNPKCIVGSHIQDTLNEIYDEIQNQAEKEMDSISLQDVIDGIWKRENIKK